MQLTRYTDYSLRLLVYLALHPDQRVTITEVAEAFAVSRNHLLKVVQRLAALGLIATYRGKRGGMRLARSPDSIRVGEVVREMEGTLEMVDCHGPACPILPSCVLKNALDEARDAFLGVLDGYRLADLVDQRQDALRRLLAV